MVLQVENSSKPPNSLKGVLHRIENVIGDTRNRLTNEGRRERKTSELIKLFEKNPDKAKEIFEYTRTHYDLYRVGGKKAFSQQRKEDLISINNFYNQPKEENGDEETRLNMLLGQSQVYTTYTGVDMTQDQEKDINEIKEHLQNVGVAYFLATNRVSRKLEEKRFDEAMEGRQLKAILAMLDGNHIHVGTGEGKSKVILPIATIVEALTSDKQSAILSTSDEVLLAELKDSTQRYLKSLSSGQEIVKEITKEQSQPNEDRQLKKQMTKEALINGGYSNKTRKSLSLDSWERVFWGQTGSDRDIVEEVGITKKPTIAYLKESDLVFAYAHLDDKEKFKKVTPTIFLDEADVPYNRRTGYHSVGEENFISPEEVINSTVDWLTRYIVGRKLKSDDFQRGEKSATYELTESAEQKVRKINFKKDIKKSSGSYCSDPEISQYFGDGINVISVALDLSKEEANLLKKTLKGNLQSSQKKFSGDILVAMANEHATIYQEAGRSFIQEKDNTLIRDAYVDQFLRNHKYEPERALTILAANGQFDLVPLRQKAEHSLFFQNFVAGAGDKLRCASGTLLYPDPKTGEIRKSQVGGFLEWATGRSVTQISPPEVKQAPTPFVFLKSSSAEESASKRALDVLVSDILQNDHPVLVISHDIKDSLKIFQELERKLGKGAVAYAGTKTDDPEYSRSTKQYFNQLAEYNPDPNKGSKLRVIVSSGSAGMGVNIMKKDDSAPDLRVIISGMPQTRAQLMQILGRRRAPGSNFGWYISEDQLERYISLYEKKIDQFNYLLGDKDIMAVREALVTNQGDHTKQLDLVLELLAKMESVNSQDDNFIVSYGPVIVSIEKRASKNIEDKVRRLIYKEDKVNQDELQRFNEINMQSGKLQTKEERKLFIENLTPTDRQLIQKIVLVENKITFIHGYIGLPSNLNQEIMSVAGFSRGVFGSASFSTMQGDQSAHMILSQLAPPTSIDKIPAVDDYLVNRLTGWYEDNLSSARQYYDLFFDSGRIKEIKPVLVLPLLTPLTSPVKELRSIRFDDGYITAGIAEFEDEGNNINQIYVLIKDNQTYLLANGLKGLNGADIIQVIIEEGKPTRLVSVPSKDDQKDLKKYLFIFE